MVRDLTLQSLRWKVRRCRHDRIYVTVTRKLRTPLPALRAVAAVRAMTKLDVVQVDVLMALAAVDTSRVAQISLWDALMIEAARQAGCRRILTEDFITRPNDPQRRHREPLSPRSSTVVPRVRLTG